MGVNKRSARSWASIERSARQWERSVREIERLVASPVAEAMMKTAERNAAFVESIQRSPIMELIAALEQRQRRTKK